MAHRRKGGKRGGKSTHIDSPYNDAIGRHRGGKGRKKKMRGKKRY